MLMPVSGIHSSIIDILHVPAHAHSQILHLLCIRRTHSIKILRSFCEWLAQPYYEPKHNMLARLGLKLNEVDLSGLSSKALTLLLQGRHEEEDAGFKVGATDRRHVKAFLSLFRAEQHKVVMRDEAGSSATAILRWTTARFRQPAMSKWTGATARRKWRTPWRRSSRDRLRGRWKPIPKPFGQRARRPSTVAGTWVEGHHRRSRLLFKSRHRAGVSCILLRIQEHHLQASCVSEMRRPDGVGRQHPDSVWPREWKLLLSTLPGHKP